MGMVFEIVLITWLVTLTFCSFFVCLNLIVSRSSVGRRCTPESVALVLCQSEPVLNDGKSGDDDSSREAVMAGVRRQFIERVVKDYEDKDTDDDDYNSD
uniref:Uncharacterized protein n=1 Tax=Brassica campestris TaxID=3711 RepID=A0A3P6AM53_BRACM|nr:unnamed protein product [Brassica rapa]